MAAGDAAMQQLAQTFANLAQSAIVGSAALTKLSASSVKLGEKFLKMDNIFGKLANTVAMLSGSFIAITASLAKAPFAVFEGLTDAFGGIISIAEKFVGALNPAIVEQLQLAFDDLYAVIGRLFVPIMAALVPIVRMFADAMVPVVNALIPTFNLLADAIMNIAGPVIGILSGLLMALAPQFEMLAGWLSSLATVIGQGLFQYIDAIVPLFSALLDAVGILMPSILNLVGALFALYIPLVQIIVPVLIPALQMLAFVVAKVVDALSWLIGKAAEGLKMIAPAQGGPGLKVPKIDSGASRGAAAKGAQFVGFAEFGKQLMEASFGSTVNTPEFKTAENTAKLVEIAEKAENRAVANNQAFQIGQPGRGKF